MASNLGEYLKSLSQVILNNLVKFNKAPLIELDSTSSNLVIRINGESFTISPNGSIYDFQKNILHDNTNGSINLCIQILIALISKATISNNNDSLLKTSNYIITFNVISLENAEEHLVDVYGFGEIPSDKKNPTSVLDVKLGEVYDFTNLISKFSCKRLSGPYRIIGITDNIGLRKKSFGSFIDANVILNGNRRKYSFVKDVYSVTDKKIKNILTLKNEESFKVSEKDLYVYTFESICL